MVSKEALSAAVTPDLLMLYTSLLLARQTFDTNIGKLAGVCTGSPELREDTDVILNVVETVSHGPVVLSPAS